MQLGPDSNPPDAVSALYSGAWPGQPWPWVGIFFGLILNFVYCDKQMFLCLNEIHNADPGKAPLLGSKAEKKLPGWIQTRGR